jgi:aryl-alcohol dehydrogenase-like predicted oxidoreductase
MRTVKWNNHIISKLCLGTVQFGLDYGIANQNGEVSQDKVNNILKYACLEGVNCFDTGSMYGSSEEKIGNFIKTQKNDSMRILSKVKSDFFQLGHKKSIKNIDKSLGLLSTSKLFALLLHNTEVIENWKDGHKILVDTLMQKNKIEFFGVSIYTNREFNMALENDSVDIIQIPFNLLDQRAINLNWIAKAKVKNKLIFIRSVYLQGLILMDIDSIPSHLNSSKKYLKTVERLAIKLNISKNELALSFVDQMAGGSVLLFGCDSLEQAVENVNNYNSLSLLDNETIEYLKSSMADVPEYIYNPSQWSGY